MDHKYLPSPACRKRCEALGGRGLFQANVVPTGERLAPADSPLPSTDPSRRMRTRTRERVKFMVGFDTCGSHADNSIAKLREYQPKPTHSSAIYIQGVTVATDKLQLQSVRTWCTWFDPMDIFLTKPSGAICWNEAVDKSFARRRVGKRLRGSYTIRAVWRRWRGEQA
jgi:hypothetical protein